MMASPSNFDLRTICSSLGKVKTEWFRIGVQLGIPRHKLKEFKDEEDPVSAVVEFCLQGNACKPFSWQSIVEALKSEHVGVPGLAEEISMKYCQKTDSKDEHSYAIESSAESKQEQSEQDTETEIDAVNTQPLENSLTELISQLHQLTQTKLKSLQRDQIEDINTQLKGYLQTMNKRSNQEDSTTMTKQVKKPKLQSVMTKPRTEACQENRKVLELAPNVPLGYIIGELNTAELGENATILLYKEHSMNWPADIPSTISCEVTSEIASTSVKASIEKMEEDSQYKISYQPTIKGRHQLHIKVEGQLLMETVSVKSPVEKLGTLLRTIDGMRAPDGVAVNQSGEILVAEGSSIQVFSPSGKKLNSFGSCGRAEGQFQHPCGVAVDDEGSILVADQFNHRIQKFTAQGKFLTTVGGSEGKKPLQFSRPSSIIFNASNNRVYVVDSGNNRIQILNSDLSFSSTFGNQGDGDGELHHPKHIACDSTGNVYVANSKNHRIQVFTAEGEFLRSFEECSKGKELKEPWGIAIDSSNRVYVSELGNCCVSVFTSEGEFLISFGQEEKLSPHALAVDSSGVVYVCDYSHNRVLLF